MQLLRRAWTSRPVNAIDSGKKKSVVRIARDRKIEQAHGICTMNAMYKVFGLIGLAFIVAVASFEDTLALALGKAGLLMAAAAFICVLVGAALSFAVKVPRQRSALFVPVADDAPDAETSHSSPT